jgi:beta-glucosidase
VAGKEVAQLYVRDVQASVQRPVKELKGFAKVALLPGEEKTVAFELNERSLAYYDPDRQAWVAEPGEFEVLIGSSSHDIRLKTKFTLQ